MKKINKLAVGLLIALAFITLSETVNAQGNTTGGFAPGKNFKQLNFGLEFDGYGVPVYIGADFGVHEMITIGPRLMFSGESETIGGEKYRWSLIVPSFRGDYHFSGHIDELPAELDIYGGASLGLAIVSYNYPNPLDPGNELDGSDSELEFWLQLGARYYFAPNWAVQLEFASYGTNGSIGISYKL